MPRKGAASVRHAITIGSSTHDRRPPKLSECNGLGQMYARFVFVLALSIGLFRGNECAHAQSESSTTQLLPPIVVSRTEPAPKPGEAQTPRRPVRALPPRLVYPTTPVSGSGSSSSIDVEKVPASVNIVDVNQIQRTQ